MSWHERKKEHEQKAAAEATRRAMEQRLKELSIHPLLNEKCSRDFCDAYFHGLVFAAFADNEEIDKGERAILNDIGASLGISMHDVDDAINVVRAVVDDYDKFGSLLDECMSVIKVNESAVKLFYAQVVQVWLSSAGDGGDSPDDDLAGMIKDMGKKTAVALQPAKLSLIMKVLKGGDELDANLLSLSEWMGEDALKYFVVKQYGDVSDILNKARRAKASAEKRIKEQARIDSVRKKFHDKAMDLSRQYGSLSYVPQGWAEKFNELFDEIDGADIDWVQECNSVLSALQEIGKGYVGKAIWRPDYQTRRKIAWRLLCMLFVHSGEIKIANDPCRWLRSISNISSEGFRKKVEKFLEENFDVTFVIPE